MGTVLGPRVRRLPSAGCNSRYYMSTKGENASSNDGLWCRGSYLRCDRWTVRHLCLLLRALFWVNGSFSYALSPCFAGRFGAALEHTDFDLVYQRKVYIASSPLLRNLRLEISSLSTPFHILYVGRCYDDYRILCWRPCVPVGKQNGEDLCPLPHYARFSPILNEPQLPVELQKWSYI